MACISLTGLAKACGSEGNMGGLEKLYVVSHADLAPAVAGDPVYTVASNGMISNISLASGKHFVEIGLVKSTSGLNESMTKNAQTATQFYTQNFTLVLAGLSVENKTFVESVANQPIAILIKSRNGKYFTAGLNGQFELSALEGGTGIAEGDLSGYTLTFSGLDTRLIAQVEASIVAGLLA